MSKKEKTSCMPPKNVWRLVHVWDSFGQPTIKFIIELQASFWIAQKSLIRWGVIHFRDPTYQISQGHLISWKWNVQVFSGTSQEVKSKCHLPGVKRLRFTSEMANGCTCGSTRRVNWIFSHQLVEYCYSKGFSNRVYRWKVMGIYHQVCMIRWRLR